MSGYIGTQPVPQATQHRETFTATAGQTSFATAGYTPQFLDVFLNGIHLLNPDDYTASNGSDVVLTTGAALDDVLEVISYSTYEVNSQNYTGGLTVDNTSATVLTVDRATSDGTIIDVQKNGSTVGRIGYESSGLYIDGESGHSGLSFGGNSVVPRDNGTRVDNVVDVGSSTHRFKDLYLSGGVYLGGTGAANKLDDVETGTWTPVWVSSGAYPAISYTQQLGHYNKVGNIVTAGFRIIISTVSGGSGTLMISGLPFQVKNTGANLFSGVVGWNGSSYNGDQIHGFVAASNNTFLYTHYTNSTGGTVDCPVSMLKNGAIIEASITYMSN